MRGFAYLAKREAFLREAFQCRFVAVKLGWLGWLAQDGVCLLISDSLVHYLFHCGANLSTHLQETVTLRCIPNHIKVIVG